MCLYVCVYVCVRIYFCSGNLTCVWDVKEVGLVIVRCEQVLNGTYIVVMMLLFLSVARDFALIERVTLFKYKSFRGIC